SNCWPRRQAERVRSLDGTCGLEPNSDPRPRKSGYMPGTELLFRDDAYVRESAATVMVAEGGRVQLDRTIFYPQGGGQPGDRGSFITEDGRVFRVTDTRKGVGADGVIHLVEGDAAG